jgi:anti-sigma-K factor RskA
MNLSRPDRLARLDALAAQYALGTLSPGARKRLVAVARVDDGVGTAMRDWELRLSALADAVPPVAPAPRVWEGIRRRLGLGLGVADAESGAATPWWASLSLWRGLALAGFALAFVLGLSLILPVAERQGERIVVVLAGQDAKPVFLVSADRARRYLTVKAVAPVGVSAERALELWALPEGKDPRSLGLLPASGSARIPLGSSAGAALQGITALAVSLEPPGGSPTGKPTGPVLYTGGVQYL